MTIIWIIVFCISLTGLVKGADWLLDSGERIGLSLGLTPFIIGAVITGVGTSLPELMSGFFALGKGATDFIVANAVGSNIANMLLVGALAMIVGKKIRVDKDLIELDIPLLILATTLFGIFAWDGSITQIESFILLLGGIIFFFYTFLYREDSSMKIDALDLDKDIPAIETIIKAERPAIRLVDAGKLVGGTIILIFGAQYLVESVIQLSTIWNVATGVIAITAVAIGTSLPELLVTILAVLKGKNDVAIGNLFGSNIFNLLIVIGLPGFFSVLVLDQQTYLIGLPFLFIATIVFVFSSISRKFYAWEGFFFLLLYFVFIAQLFSIF